MATWDGSYPFTEDPNYYLYSEQSVAGPATRNPGYCSVRGNNAYLQQAEPVFDQNCMMAYHPVEGNVPSVPTNLIPVATNYREHQYVPGPIEPTRPPDTFQYYPDGPKSTRIRNAVFHSRNRRAKSHVGWPHPKEPSNVRANIAEQSNLQVTADEFVPNENRQRAVDRLGSPASVSPAPVQQVPDKSTSRHRPVFSDLDNGGYDKKYRSRKPSNYGPRDRGFQKGNECKNSYGRQANEFTKYDNSRYDSGKQVRRFRKGASDYGARRSNSAEYNGGKDSPQSGAPAQEEFASTSRSEVNRNDLASSDREEDTTNFKEDGRHANRTRKYGKCTKVFAYWNSGRRQSQPKDERESVGEPENQGRSENGVKDRRQNLRRFNGIKEDGSKESKFEEEEDGEREKGTGKRSIMNNWRQKRASNKKSTTGKKESNEKNTMVTDDVASQRERLTDQLNRGNLECLVCCEYIRQADSVWSCSNCYHVLHLECVKKWADSSKGANGWRCPACQNSSLTMPEDYFCFCGKRYAPEWNRRDTAHSCGEVCARTLSKNNCVHKCTLLCHPGCCPVCTAMVTKHCGCGRTSQPVQCSAQTVLLCDSTCEKKLNCKRHRCERGCHHGDCEPCEASVEQECYCGKNKRTVTCYKNIPAKYSCEEACGKPLNCGNHVCKKPCHPDECEPCSLTPDKVRSCCCGQTPLEMKRESCLDPVPTCDQICSKILQCGPPDKPHTCKAVCHEGECPECDETTEVRCRCRRTSVELSCKELRSMGEDVLCQKRCKGTRSCRKHVCNQVCCVDVEHHCPLPCSKTLNCGRHKCEKNCHRGKCRACWRSSFEELYCECGASFLLPPVRCGARRPPCNRPCSREHSCGHEVLHNCHSDPNCPPCTVLTERWCHGKHELRKAVPCYVEGISCGLPCNKPLSCGRHKCISICHPGPCEKPGQQCSQLCPNPREICGHACAARCHEGKCPDTPCKEMVKVTCQCGHRSMSRACAENAKEYQRIASSILASKMLDMQLGNSIDLEEIFGQGPKKQNQLKTLECNDECKLVERNRRLALGLQIVNPDLSGKLMPKYSDFMKQWAKKDPRFCQMVHEKLTVLVHSAKISKQKSRSYSFESMNRDKRHFVSEMCEHFGCESQSYDQEPNRNVVATAVKDKCWLPSYSLLEIVQRENGQRKVPGPMLSTSTRAEGGSTRTSLPLKKTEKILPPSKLPVESEIDYFDYPGLLSENNGPH